MATNNPFIEPMSTAITGGSDLSVDLFVDGIGMKMGLTSQNAGMALVGLTGLAIGVLIGCMATSKLTLNADHIVDNAHTGHISSEYFSSMDDDFGAKTTIEELEAQLSALETGSDLAKLHESGNEPELQPEPES